MDNLLTISLEAHNPEKNHHRYYSFTVGRDLFGDWSVCVRYGRIGRRGQEERHSASEPETVRAVIRNRLKKRQGAPKRIGCAYRLTGLDIAKGFDGSAWIPANMITAFIGRPS